MEDRFLEVTKGRSLLRLGLVSEAEGGECGVGLGGGAESGARDGSSLRILAEIASVRSSQSVA